MKGSMHNSFTYSLKKTLISFVEIKLAEFEYVKPSFKSSLPLVFHNISPVCHEFLRLLVKEQVAVRLYHFSADIVVKPLLPLETLLLSFCLTCCSFT